MNHGVPLSFLPFSPIILLTFFLGFSFFITIYFLLQFYVSHSQYVGRYKELRNYQPTGRIGEIERLRNPSLNKRLSAMKRRKKTEWFKKTLKFIQEHFLIEEEKLKLKFKQGGWESKNTLSFFIGGKVALMLLGFILAWVLIFSIPFIQISGPQLKVFLYLILPLFGWFVLDYWLAYKIKKRFSLIEMEFPQALDLIVICINAGLTFNRSIERVAREIRGFSQEISHELAIMSIELEIILDPKQALNNLSQRVSIPLIKTFTTTLLQSIQQGTPLLHAMDTLSKEIREDAMQAAEAKAAKLPSLLVLPLVLMILPSLFIILLGPTIIHLIRAL